MKKGSKILIKKITAQYVGTNCWIVAPEAGAECVIVDPGITTPSMLNEIADSISESKLKPIAILVTHGHLDHTFSVLPVSKSYQIPAVIHKKDRTALGDPFSILVKDGPLSALMKEIGADKFQEPDEVISLDNEGVINFPGLKIKYQHAPGHTAGSAIFDINETHLISGDLLFAGAIGRTDLPTGSEAQMKETLRNIILPKSNELVVLPGHGLQTTIGVERDRNPYLQSDYLGFSGELL